MLFFIKPRNLSVILLAVTSAFLLGSISPLLATEVIESRANLASQIIRLEDDPNTVPAEASYQAGTFSSLTFKKICAGVGGLLIFGGLGGCGYYAYKNSSSSPRFVRDLSQKRKLVRIKDLHNNFGDVGPSLDSSAMEGNAPQQGGSITEAAVGKKLQGIAILTINESSVINVPSSQRETLNNMNNHQEEILRDRSKQPQEEGCVATILTKGSVIPKNSIVAIPTGDNNFLLQKYISEEELVSPFGEGDNRQISYNSETKEYTLSQEQEGGAVTNEPVIYSSMNETFYDSHGIPLYSLLNGRL